MRLEKRGKDGWLSWCAHPVTPRKKMMAYLNPFCAWLISLASQNSSVFVVGMIECSGLMVVGEGENDSLAYVIITQEHVFLSS